MNGGVFQQNHFLRHDRVSTRRPRWQPIVDRSKHINRSLTACLAVQRERLGAGKTSIFVNGVPGA